MEARLRSRNSTDTVREAAARIGESGATRSEVAATGIDEVVGEAIVRTEITMNRETTKIMGSRRTNKVSRKTRIRKMSRRTPTLTNRPTSRRTKMRRTTKMSWSSKYSRYIPATSQTIKTTRNKSEITTTKNSIKVGSEATTMTVPTISGKTDRKVAIAIRKMRIKKADSKEVTVTGEAAIARTSSRIRLTRIPISANGTTTTTLSTRR